MNDCRALVKDLNRARRLFLSDNIVLVILKKSTFVKSDNLL